MWRRVASLPGLEKSKPVSTHIAASDGNDLVGGEPGRDKETSSLYRSIVGARLYMGHDKCDATCAIRLFACDLCAANEDFDVSKKGCAVSVPRKGTRNFLPSLRWTRDERTCSACE